jgi:Ca2+-binding EF-hand superfamily protein
MHYPSTKTTIALFIGLSLGSNAMAMHHGKGLKPPINLSEVEQQADQRFTEADTDQDGLLSRTEFAAAKLLPGNDEYRGRGHKKRRHGKMQDNLTPEERETRRQNQRARLAQEFPEHAARQQEIRSAAELELFKLMDDNGDGQLNADEFTKPSNRPLRQQARQTATFNVLDSNADGFLARNEMPDPVARLRRLDANEDGVVSKREMRKGLRALAADKP